MTEYVSFIHSKTDKYKTENILNMPWTSFRSKNYLTLNWFHSMEIGRREKKSPEEKINWFSIDLFDFVCRHFVFGASESFKWPQKVDKVEYECKRMNVREKVERYCVSWQGKIVHFVKLHYLLVFFFILTVIIISNQNESMRERSTCESVCCLYNFFFCLFDQLDLSSFSQCFFFANAIGPSSM